MAADLEYWTVEETGGVVVASFDHPPMNYFTAGAVGELRSLLAEWRDPAVRAVVLTALRPEMFVTHFSVEALLEAGRDREGLIRSGIAMTQEMHSYREQILALPKPVIAAMRGDAMGGGLELALSTDIRIAEEGDFRFGLPEVRFGILPGGTGTQRLSRLVGLATAVELILRGRLVDPEEALRIGLVHEVAGDSLARAREIAAELATLPPRALAMAKQAVYEGSDAPLRAGLRIEAEALFHTRISRNAQEAMEAYVALPFEQRRDWIENGPMPAFSEDA